MTGTVLMGLLGFVSLAGVGFYFRRRRAPADTRHAPGRMVIAANLVASRQRRH